MKPTEWLSNIPEKEKPNGKIRICIERSQTINRAIKTETDKHHPDNRRPKAKVFTIVLRVAVQLINFAIYAETNFLYIRTV